MPEPKPEPSPRASRPPHNPSLLRLIEAKRQWHSQPDAEAARHGFLGWHERGYLPHFDAPNVTQFVSFMLDDAFPVMRRREWEPILRQPDESPRRRKLQAWLDRGHGEFWLQQPEVAGRVEEIVRVQDGQTYRLQAWVVMPNHVHLVVDVRETPLSMLLNLWKGRSSYDANRLLARRGRFWEKEYFDILIRDSGHLGRAIRYTENNPVKAGLVLDSKTWPWSCARWRDEYGRLPWQREATQEREARAERSLQAAGARRSESRDQAGRIRLTDGSAA